MSNSQAWYSLTELTQDQVYILHRGVAALAARHQQTKLSQSLEQLNKEKGCVGIAVLRKMVADYDAQLAEYDALLAMLSGEATQKGCMETVEQQKEYAALDKDPFGLQAKAAHPVQSVSQTPVSGKVHHVLTTGQWAHIRDSVRESSLPDIADVVAAAYVLKRALYESNPTVSLPKEMNDALYTLRKAFEGIIDDDAMCAE